MKKKRIWLGTWLPRLRGDGPYFTRAVNNMASAAPPTRGWTRTVSPMARAPSGCPAYAGMDPIPRHHQTCLVRLPRLRGDGPRKKAIMLAPTGAAPPTRGWTRGSHRRMVAVQGCPAYAGMDPMWARPAIHPIRLPRLRGDGPWQPKGF